VTAERETVVEVQAPQLVSCFVNETAKKTAEEIKKAQGGVLFVDEAYRLSPESSNDHGRECVQTLLFLLIGRGWQSRSSAPGGLTERHQWQGD
jgi:SpoVK/Ycf46/Vps4 family AAA+-type ATPase